MADKILDSRNFDLIIMKSGVDGVMHSKLRDFVRQSNSNDTLFIVLDTSGGIPIYAYRAMKLLGAKYKNIYSVIPDASMSAGTLMALGTDAIGMFPDSCLGPLDLQITHPDIDDEVISALDIRDTASDTTSEAAAIARKIFADNLGSGIRRNVAERMAVELATSMYCPIMEKIDPYRMHESIRSASVGSIYGARLLASRMMKNKKQKAVSVSVKLANGYNYHGYAITKDEAIELGLEVFDIEIGRAHV